MRLGIFAKTFDGRNLDEVLVAVTRHGITAVQFNLSCAGLETLPQEIEPEVCSRIRSAFESRGLEMAALSGTYNMIDPDQARRELMTRRALQLIRVAPELGTRMVTLCTGSRDRENMWRAHSDNNLADSWSDLIHTLADLIPIAEASGVTLGIEPEQGNVINSARKAHRLLDEVRSPFLKIVLDGANLLDPPSLTNMEDTFHEAFDLLGGDIQLVHAKEIPASPEMKLATVGKGRMNWSAYFDGIRSIRFDGPIIIHNVEPRQVDESVRFVRESLAERGLHAR